MDDPPQDPGPETRPEPQRETQPDAGSEDASTWRRLAAPGRTLADAGRHAEAAEKFERASKYRPGHTGILSSLGAALLRSGEPARALDAFDAALRLAPFLANCLNGRGLALCALGDISGALGAFRLAAAQPPASWSAWQSIADITPDEAERIFAIAQAAAALEETCRRAPAPPALFGRCSSALIDAHRFGDAARFAQSHRSRFGSLAAADNAAARAHYNAGNFEDAFRLKARALKRLLPGEAARQALQPGFDPVGAAGALRELVAILAANGAGVFLTAGTLLGYHRTGAPLRNDRDIDIGIVRQPDGSPDIAGLLRRHPCLVLPRVSRPGDRYFGIRYKGVAADLFLYDACGSSVSCGLGNIDGDIQWRFSRFALGYRAYGGELWPTPDDPERLLAENYGPGWRVPDTGFASAVSSPALYRTNVHAKAYYAAGRAMNAWLAGDRPRARALQRQSPLPFSLPPQVQDGGFYTPDTDDPDLR